MTPSRNTRSYKLRSIPSSPGRSFLVVTEDPSKKGMRPIELFWTAKKATTAIKTMTKTILGFVTFETLCLQFWQLWTWFMTIPGSFIPTLGCHSRLLILIPSVLTNKTFLARNIVRLNHKSALHSTVWSVCTSDYVILAESHILLLDISWYIWIDLAAPTLAVPDSISLAASSPTCVAQLTSFCSTRSFWSFWHMSEGVFLSGLIREEKEHLKIAHVSCELLSIPSPQQHSHSVKSPVVRGSKCQCKGKADKEISIYVKEATHKHENINTQHLKWNERH